MDLTSDGTVDYMHMGFMSLAIEDLFSLVLTWLCNIKHAGY